MAQEPRGEIIEPGDAELRRIIAEQEHASRAKVLDMGLLGHLFGSVADKPGNIAGFAIVFFS
jgi:hypothetical protein